MLFDLISELARPLFAKLLEDDPVPVDELRARVLAHGEHLKAAGGAVDLRLSAELTESCNGLLDSLTEFSGDTSRKLVQAACLYFVLEDDASPDTGDNGLVDDVEVLNAVAKHLDLERLIIRLDK